MEPSKSAGGGRKRPRTQSPSKDSGNNTHQLPVDELAGNEALLNSGEMGVAKCRISSLLTPYNYTPVRGPASVSSTAGALAVPNVNVKSGAPRKTLLTPDNRTPAFVSPPVRRTVIDLTGSEELHNSGVKGTPRRLSTSTLSSNDTARVPFPTASSPTTARLAEAEALLGLGKNGKSSRQSTPSLSTGRTTPAASQPNFSRDEIAAAEGLLMLGVGPADIKGKPLQPMPHPAPISHHAERTYTRNEIAAAEGLLMLSKGTINFKENPSNKEKEKADAHPMDDFIRTMNESAADEAQRMQSTGMAQRIASVQRSREAVAVPRAQVTVEDREAAHTLLTLRTESAHIMKTLVRRHDGSVGNAVKDLIDSCGQGMLDGSKTAEEIAQLLERKKQVEQSAETQAQLKRMAEKRCVLPPGFDSDTVLMVSREETSAAMTLMMLHHDSNNILAGNPEYRKYEQLKKQKEQCQQQQQLQQQHQEQQQEQQQRQQKKLQLKWQRPYLSPPDKTNKATAEQGIAMKKFRDQYPAVLSTTKKNTGATVQDLSSSRLHLETPGEKHDARVMKHENE